MNEKVTLMDSPSAHFEDKEALVHVIEKRAEGIASFSEIHGTEIPGHISSFADAARETSIVLLLLWVLGTSFQISSSMMLGMLISFGIAWTIWKTGRSGWLGWSRLERLHRIVEQEKYELEHHREQEKEELTALYRAKGFEGKLLEDVINVLMADGERLLKVMLEEELGLTLQTHEHPLKQAIGAFLGAFLSAAAIITSYLFLSNIGILIISLIVIAAGAAISAKFERNRLLHAIIWNISIAGLSFGFIYFVSQLIINP